MSEFNKKYISLVVSMIVVSFAISFNICYFIQDKNYEYLFALTAIIFNGATLLRIVKDS